MSDLSPLEDERLSALLARAQSVVDAPIAPPSPARPHRSRRALALGAVGIAAVGFSISRAGTGDDQLSTPAAPTVSAQPSTPTLPSTGPSTPIPGPIQAAPPVVAPPLGTAAAAAAPAAAASTTVVSTTTPTAAVPAVPATSPATTPAPTPAPAAVLLTGTPAEFLPGGQPWPNGLYIDAIMYMRGTVPDEQTSLDLQQRVERILGAGSVRNEFVVDPTAAAVETVIVRLGQSVLFKSGSDEINPEYYGGFALWGGFLQTNPDVTMTVIGHTDDQGTVEYNLKLSQQRAEAARLKIIEGGIDASRVTAVSVGFDDPIADNDTSAGRALNRRIEFAVTGLFGRSGG